MTTPNAAKAEENIPAELKDQMKGADVEYKDVGWRIRAGLTRDQAIATAKQEKFEKEIEAYTEKNKGKTEDDLREIAEDAGMQPDHNASRNQLIILILQSGKVKSEVGSQRSEVGSEAEDLEDLTVPELRDLAAKRHIDLAGKTTKADIIDAIEAKE